MRPLPPDFDALVINGGQWTLAFAEANRASTSAEVRGARARAGGCLEGGGWVRTLWGPPQERLSNFLHDVDELIAALAASSHAAELRRRVLWRSISPIEWMPERHRAPYNNFWLRRADVEAKRRWRAAGYKVRGGGGGAGGGCASA